MEDLLKNKKIFIICLIIVLIGIIVYSFIESEKNVELVYSNDENVNYLKNYGVNEYIPVYVEEADVVIKYLNDFKNSLLGDLDVSYNLLNEEYRNKRFGNKESYENYVEKMLSVSTYNMEVDKYKVVYSEGVKYFDVYATDGNHYIFKEKSIMNYEVYLDNYTVKIG